MKTPMCKAIFYFVFEYRLEHYSKFIRVNLRKTINN